jgi:hypothetical protein
VYLVAKVSIAEYSWCDEGPGVEGSTEPGGDDLHPHGGRVGGEIRQVIIVAGTERRLAFITVSGALVAANLILTEGMH